MDDGHRNGLDPVRLRAELHIGLLATLAATLAFTSSDLTAVKLVAALIAACGAGKVASHWELLGRWPPFFLSAGVAFVMAVNFWLQVAGAFHREMFQPWPVILGLLLGAALVWLFHIQRPGHSTLRR